MQSQKYKRDSSTITDASPSSPAIPKVSITRGGTLFRPDTDKRHSLAKDTSESSRHREGGTEMEGVGWGERLPFSKQTQRTPNATGWEIMPCGNQTQQTPTQAKKR